MMLAMAHTLVTEQRHDRDFLARYCTGFDAFERYLLGATDGVAENAGMGRCDLRRARRKRSATLARRAVSVRSLITCAWSLQRAHHGEQPYWAAIALAAMLGGIGLPGGGFAFGHGSINGVGVPRARIAGSGDRECRSIRRERAIPVARMADMLLQPGQSYEFNGRRSVYPDIKLIYWAGGNPFHHHQDLNRLRRAWQKPRDRHRA